MLRRARRARGAARPHRGGPARRARPARRRARWWCISRTHWSSPRIAAAASPPGCARCRSRRRALRGGPRAARRTRRSCSSPRWSRDPAEPARLARLRSYERAGFARSIPRPPPYAQPDFRAPEVLPTRRRERCRSGSCCAASDARTRRRCPPPSCRRRRVDLRGVRRARARPWRSTRCARRRPRWTARSRRFRRYHRRRDHGLPPPRLRGADRRSRDADAEVPAGGGRARGARAACASRRRRRSSRAICCASTRADYVEAVRTGEPRALAESQKFPWSPAL